MKIKHGLAALALLGAASLAGCNDAAYSNPSVSYANGACTASADEVGSYPTNEGTGIHVEKYKGAYWVVGQVWITCAPPPASHHLDIELYFKSFSSNTWEKNPARTQPYTNVPPSDTQFPFAVIYPCTPGQWQARWQVVGTDGVGELYSYSHQWAPVTLTALGCKLPSPTNTAPVEN